MGAPSEVTAVIGGGSSSGPNGSWIGMSGVGRGGGRVAGGGDGVVDRELEGLDLLDEDLTREGIFLNRSSILPRE